MSDEPRPPSSQSSGSSRPAAWEPPSPEELQKLLPKYEVSKLLGRGGMGAVYKGTQRSLDRPVAIKILSAELDEREQGFAERFKNEARSMAKLNHPGIIGVHDFGQTPEGMLYIAMEFVAGTDVSRMIAKQSRLPPEHALSITAHVCDALDYAHGKGIIHRDIKPANVMVSYEGVVKVADFGLAKMTHAQNTGLTQSGMAMGTLHYMAPEALMLGSSVDHRADIYAVGVMLYQMLTGKLPQGMFDPPSQQIPGLDPRFDEIIKQAIRDDREVRYQSVLALRTALDAILTQPVARVEAAETGEQAAAPAALPTQARPQRTSPQTAPRQKAGAPVPPPPKKSSVPLVAGTLAALGIIGAAMVMLGGAGEKKTPASAAVAAPANLTQVTKTAPPATVPPPAVAPQKPWPAGPNYRSAGQFRAWSTIPNDPVMDLTPLKGERDVRQVHLHEKGWVVLMKDGSMKANALGANGLRNIRRICPGHAASFALIDNDGKLVMHGVNPDDQSRQPPADLGRVKDAFIAPFFHAALQEDGKLVVWGKGFDGILEPGKNIEWKVKPALPAGTKAVAMSATDNTLAVRLEDGTLRAWNVGSGELKLPDEFGPGKTKAFLITRNDLFVVPTEGKGVLFWPLKGGDPVRRLYQESEIAHLLPSFRDLVMVTPDGTPMVRPNILDSAPQIKDALAAISGGKASHLSACFSHGESAPLRLIWFEEEPPPLVKTAPRADEPWPADGPYFRQVGRFKAWHSEPHPPLFGDLGRLKGIEDVTQVGHAEGMWIVLRKNGETISTGGMADRKNIARIVPGFGKSCVLIDRDGGIEVVGPNLEKQPERLPPKGLKVVDGYLGTGANFAITREGGLVTWGAGFDGKNEPGNPEWKTRPELPPGRKAAGLASTDFTTAVWLEDSRVMLWNNDKGQVELPVTLSARKFGQMAVTRGRFYGLPLEGGAPVGWVFGDPAPLAVPGVPAAVSVDGAGTDLVVFLTPEGRPVFAPHDSQVVSLFDPVIGKVRQARPGLIAFRMHRYKGGDVKGWMLWYDGAPQPASAPAMLVASKAPAAGARPLDQVPEFVTRVANYQKTRHVQLSDLLGKYRNALAAAREESKKSGVLADVTELDTALLRTDSLMGEVEGNLAATQVRPLATLPPLGSHVPQRLKDLRVILDREMVKIESTLVAALDQSLAVAQRDLVKAAELDTARALEARRKEILAAFPKPVVETSASPESKTTVANTPPPAPVKSVTTAPATIQASPASRLQGRIKTWWKVPPPGAGPLGPLQKWTNYQNAKQTYSGTLGDLTDCVAVACDHQRYGFSALRANGDLVMGQPEYDKAPNSSVVAGFSALTANPPAGTRFVAFGENRNRGYVIDDQGKPGVFWRGMNPRPPLDPAGVMEAAVEQDSALVLLRNGDIVWWGRNYDNNALNKKWLQPPQAARQSVVAVSQSRYVSAVVSQSGQIFAWGESGGESVSTKATNVIDVVAVEREVYALTQTGDVIIACSADRRLKGDVLFQNAAWIKPAGTALLAGLKDGTVVTDPVTAKLEPALPAMLQLVKGLPAEAVDMYILIAEKTEVLAEAQLIWIEPVAAARATTGVSSAPAVPSAQEITISDPARATKGQPFANSLGMRFVPVPGTKVLMCIHETRRQDYEVYAGEKPGINAEWKAPSYKHKSLSTEANHPLVMVDRADALAFCDWLTAREGVRHRLPTDREWSWAAGLGGKESANGTPYSLSKENKGLRYWGEEWPPTKSNLGNYSDKAYKELFANANAIDGGKSYDDGHAFTSPVMSFPPNRLGIYDLDGNVMERCQDFFDDPAGEKDLARGSYWAAWNPGQLLISHRETGGIGKRTPHCGIRVVIELP